MEGRGRSKKEPNICCNVYNKNESNQKIGCKAGTTAKGRSITLGNIFFLKGKNKVRGWRGGDQKGKYFLP